MKKIDVESVTDTHAHTKRLTSTAGNGRTLPPVRRRDQFPASRSTRSVHMLKARSKLSFALHAMGVGEGVFYRNRKRTAPSSTEKTETLFVIRDEQEFS